MNFPAKEMMRFVTGKIMLLMLPVFVFTHKSLAQQSYFDSLLNATLAQDSIFLDELMANESSSILDLLDSMIMLGEPKSSLSARLSYTSNIAYAGRDFGVQQFGFAAGLAYYHKSGLFTGINGFWNKQVTPQYNPTTTSLGCIGTLGKKFSYIVNYDHYFYRKDEQDDLLESYPLTNAVSVSAYLDFKPLSVGADYSFLFGEETANRIRFNFLKRLKWNDRWIFDRISLSPGASVLAGNQNLYTISQSFQVNEEEVLRALIDEYGYLSLRRLWRNNRNLFKLLYADKALELGQIVQEETEKNVFGIMNYSVSVPAYFSIKNFTLGISYSLNIPVALPGEDIEIEPNSYFNVSLIYNLFFK